MTQQDPVGASAGTPGGRAPSGATSPGTTPADAAPESGNGNELDETQVPGQLPGTDASPVPSPGDVPGASLPAVAAGQGPSPETGIDQGDKAPGSDATTASPGAYVALSPPGHPDGEVDTRAR
jgi:hypothetical protein